MIKSKAIQVLKTFSEEEFRSFGRFVNSPFHNHNKNLSRMYIFLKKHYPLFEEKNFNKENLYKFLFPNQTFKDVKVRELMSDLLKVEQRFLVINGFLKKGLEPEIILLNELNIREIDNLYETVFNSITKNSVLKNWLNEDTYKYLMDIYEQKINYNLIRGKIDKVFDDAVAKRENLITYFLIRFFKSTQDIKQIEKTDKDISRTGIADKLIMSMDYEGLFADLKDDKDKSHKILEMYYYMMMLYIKKDEKYYFRFKQLIIENINSLTSGEIYDLLVSLNNCSQYLINSGKPKFLEEFLYAYKLMLSKGVYKTVDSPYMSAFDFRNIVGAGAQQKDFDWTENFISEYKDKLEPVQKDNLVNYSKALLSYYKNDYETSLTLLSSVKDTNIVFKIDIRTLLIRIYYDLNAYEEFLSLAEAFKQTMNKSSILDKERKLHIINFIKYTVQLFKIKLDKDKEKLFIIKNMILSNNKISIKFWLMDKINELERII